MDDKNAEYTVEFEHVDSVLEGGRRGKRQMVFTQPRTQMQCSMLSEKCRYAIKEPMAGRSGMYIFYNTRMSHEGEIIKETVQSSLTVKLPEK